MNKKCTQCKRTKDSGQFTAHRCRLCTSKKSIRDKQLKAGHLLQEKIDAKKKQEEDDDDKEA